MPDAAVPNGDSGSFWAKWVFNHGRWTNLDTLEKFGLLYWVPLAAVITIVELTGTLADKKRWIPWTTISTATGHLETKWHWFALIVVAVIVLVVYLGASYAQGRKEEVGSLKPLALIAAETQPSANERVGTLGLGGPVYDIIVIVGALVVGVAAHAVSDSKFVGAYWVYGVFLMFGIVIPSGYATVKKKETTLFGAIRSLEWVLPWGSYALIAGMTVLAFHLAIYPWPNISHQSPDITNGTTWEQAETAALREVNSRGSYYAIANRGTMGRSDAWIVTLYLQSGGGPQCVFAVTSASTATPLGQGC
jgi:hypothetical protein